MNTWETLSGHSVHQLLSGRSNVFLLSDKERNILIDTGTKFRWKKLHKRLQRMNVKSIDYLILTHTHFDHAANSNRIKETYNAKVIVHKNEISYLAKGVNVVPQGTNLISKTFIFLFAKMLLPFVKYDPCETDLTLDSVFSLNNLGFNAYLIRTPGHTPGSISLIIDDELALAGDTMFGVFPWSVYPPFANDPLELLESWGKLLHTMCKVFIPSHGSANQKSLVEKDFNRRIAFKISPED